MAEKKEKRYLSDNAQLMAEWNWEKNNELGFTPSRMTCQSNKKAWWKCSNGHEWETKISNRYNGKGCPYCSGRYAIGGENDLLTSNPTLVKEWNYEKNGTLRPENFTPNSGMKIWWKCEKGHEWQSAVYSRNRGADCPYCAEKKVLVGFNDLKTSNPSLAREWNYEKNNGLKPTEVLPNSNKKAWWKCSRGHEWQSIIAHRNNGIGCPICNSERHTSFQEYVLVYYLKQFGLDVLHSYNEKGFELDIYIPSKEIAIEYDGYYWHRNREKNDLEKNAKCVKHGIKLYRIREGLLPLFDSSIDYVIQSEQETSKIFSELLSEIIGYSVNVDLERDAIAIDNLREYTEKENSLLLSNPTLAAEWNYKKNNNLKPENFTPNSNKKVWWKCSKNHEWQATISDRNRGRGCPYCSGRYAVKGENDLQTINPTLTKEWNYEKNGNMMPDTITANSGKKVWWKCSEGHEWQARIDSRNNGNGCPECAKINRTRKKRF